MHPEPADGVPTHVRDEPAKGGAPSRLVGGGRPIELAIAEIAGRQRGTISRAQLLAIDVTRRGIERRLADGRLHRLFLGVFLVGHAVPPLLARETAALIACGSGCFLSHRTAGAIWALDAPPGTAAPLRGRPAAALPATPRNPLVDVTSTRSGPRGQRGLRVHRVQRLDAADSRMRHGLPLTAPARTLLDLASVLSAQELADTVERARVLRLVTGAHIRTAMQRTPGRRGAPALRRLLVDEPTMTRSKAERRLLTLVARAGLPRPATNVPLHGHEVDLLWRAQRLVVEVDGYAYHAHREAFERDRRRDAELQAAGYRVIRVTWRRMADEPEALLVTLAQALAAGT